MGKMTSMGEQIGRDRRIVNADWAFAKRQTNRKRRRLEKIYGDNAPKKNQYAGYVG